MTLPLAPEGGPVMQVPLGALAMAMMLIVLVLMVFVEP